MKERERSTYRIVELSRDTSKTVKISLFKTLETNCAAAAKSPQ